MVEDPLAAIAMPCRVRVLQVMSGQGPPQGGGACIVLTLRRHQWKPGAAQEPRAPLARLCGAGAWMQRNNVQAGRFVTLTRTAAGSLRISMPPAAATAAPAANAAPNDPVLRPGQALARKRPAGLPGARSGDGAVPAGAGTASAAVAAVASALRAHEVLLLQRSLKAATMGSCAKKRDLCLTAAAASGLLAHLGLHLPGAGQYTILPPALLRFRQHPASGGAAGGGSPATYAAGARLAVSGAAAAGGRSGIRIKGLPALGDAGARLPCMQSGSGLLLQRPNTARRCIMRCHAHTRTTLLCLLVLSRKAGLSHARMHSHGVVVFGRCRDIRIQLQRHGARAATTTHRTSDLPGRPACIAGAQVGDTLRILLLPSKAWALECTAAVSNGPPDAVANTPGMVGNLLSPPPLSTPLSSPLSSPLSPPPQQRQRQQQQPTPRTPLLKGATYTIRCKPDIKGGRLFFRAADAKVGAAPCPAAGLP